MNDFDPIINNFEKPITYLNNEINSFHPDIFKAKVKVAIGYPDLYEVGMSNLGIRIIYDIVNNMESVACERFFAPGNDFETYLRTHNIPLFTLESHTPLKDFDFVGFSISSELNYTNVINMLSLSNIPLRSVERKDGDPIIIAGGNCSFHPESLSDFIDIWVIGEAEETIVEMIKIYRELKGIKREKIIKELTKIKGVYAPLFYRVNDENLVPAENGVPEVIERRFVNDFENVPFPTRWIVPLCEIIHDRISLEIMRGCPQSCLFCQGGFCWKPVRKKSAEKIIKLGLDAYHNTGYEEISLLSFSSGDHPEIEKIVMGLTEKLGKYNVAISFPSLRIDSFSFHLANQISQVRRTGLTFAPETGETLRKFIGKPISDEKLLSLASEAKRTKWRQLKLYFMIGLPGENEQTIKEIEQLIRNVSKIISVKCSFTTFIPKPHTPFQWEKFPDYLYHAEIEKRIKTNFSKNRFVHISFHPYEMSAIECLLSRGNRKLGNVVEMVWKNGGKMENWSEFFDFHRWNNAMEKHSLNFDDFLSENNSIHRRWNHIKASFPIDALEKMRKNFYQKSGIIS
ncbi:MAG: TIGR03960 family B12-binding radical SAM protein [Candidatus Omnitrophica bacterium]|nr:TIGR03960 family B12-binding radical SAM protein [Candidatus Omnitrophota bacterium]